MSLCRTESLGDILCFLITCHHNLSSISRTRM
uniref:Uncharacterized protein n=1 Tax=Arundo donax TaxID=35708 RepID=A0A0A8Y2A3_ARUDO